MKKILTISACMLFTCFCTKAQNDPTGDDWITPPAGSTYTLNPFVGIGTATPLYELHVARNTTGAVIAVQNLGGNGGATFRMIDDKSGADFAFKSTGTGNFKIRDQKNALDVLTIKGNGTGNVGIGTASPGAKLEVSDDIIVNGLSIGKGSSGGNNNSLFGFSALSSDSTGYNNTAIGSYALTSNKTGRDNVAVGNDCLTANIGGTENIAIGSRTLADNNVSGSQNIALGVWSLRKSNGSSNISIGVRAMNENGSGSNNVAVGGGTMWYNFIGNHNTAIGDGSLFYNNGDNNTAVGSGAGNGSFFTVSNALFLGFNATATNDSLTNCAAIGVSAVIDSSNKISIGNNSIVSVGGQVSWTAYSDARIKDNVNENVPGLAFINKLRPVTYNYNISKQNRIIGISNDKDWDGKYDIEKIQFSGFLAQEVIEASNEANYNFSGIDKQGTLLGLRYAEFVVPLVKAVQEQQEEIEELEEAVAKSKNYDEEISALHDAIKILREELQNKDDKIDVLTQQMAQFDFDMQQCCITHQNNGKTGGTQGLEEQAHLAQNIPNPFNQRTVIKYYLPKNSEQSQIRVSDLEGNLISVFEINEKGYGQIEISANTLVPATYIYELIVGNKLVASKKMIIQ